MATHYEMPIERLALDWLKQHTEADEIVMDTVTGLPVKAVYSGPTATGHVRTRSATYYLEDWINA